MTHKKGIPRPRFLYCRLCIHLHRGLVSLGFLCKLDVVTVVAASHFKPQFEYFHFQAQVLCASCCHGIIPHMKGLLSVSELRKGELGACMYGGSWECDNIIEWLTSFQL